MPYDFKLSRKAVLLAAVSACYPLAGGAAPVARVDFAAGSVSAISATGQSRPLAKGGEINEGDTVAVRDGRAQLRFTDGAQMSLLPQTDFKVEEYRYSGKADGSEKGFFSLIRGGLRTITGAIGRSNRQSYQVKTAVATIGIRGTSYSLRYTNSIEGTVGDGSTNVCNKAGCEAFSAGESFYVADENTLPVQTYNPPELGDQSPRAMNLPGYSAGSVPLLQGAITGGSLAIAYDAMCCGPVVRAYSDADWGGWYNPAGRFTLDSNGALVNFADGNNGNWTTTQGSMARFADGNDGIVSWGRWVGGVAGGNGVTAGEGVRGTLHYVAGVPTSAADMSNLRIANVIGTYTWMGGTVPTMGSSTGTLNSASLMANFGAGTVTAGVNATVGGNAFIASGTGAINGPSANTFNFGFGSFSGSGCAAEGCNVSIAGLFAGRYASRAGFTYAIYSNLLGQTVVGAAVFKR